MPSPKSFHGVKQKSAPCPRFKKLSATIFMPRLLIPTSYTSGKHMQKLNFFSSGAGAPNSPPVYLDGFSTPSRRSLSSSRLIFIYKLYNTHKI